MEESSEEESDIDDSDSDDDDDDEVTSLDPSVVGRSLKIEDVIKKYAGKGKKNADSKKLTSQAAAASAMESSIADTSSYSMTTTSDPTASKNL